MFFNCCPNFSDAPKKQAKTLYIVVAVALFFLNSDFSYCFLGSSPSLPFSFEALLFLKAFTRRTSKFLKISGFAASFLVKYHVIIPYPLKYLHFSVYLLPSLRYKILLQY